MKKGETIAVLHGNDEQKLAIARERLLHAYTFLPKPVEKKTLIRGIIS